MFTFFNGAATYPPVPYDKVLSAAAALTVVFGMGTGVSPPRIATPIFLVATIDWKHAH